MGMRRPPTCGVLLMMLARARSMLQMTVLVMSRIHLSPKLLQRRTTQVGTTAAVLPVLQPMAAKMSWVALPRRFRALRAKVVQC